MKLADVSTFFDRSEVRDADTNALICKGQLSNYDDTRRDSLSAYRRVLSVKAGTSSLEGRVVTVLGRTWIVGSLHTDGWESPHRDKYVAHRARGKAKVQRLADYLQGVVTAQAWADVQWVADRKEVEVSSRVPQLFSALLPSGADVRVNDVVVLDINTVLVQSVALHATGLLEARGLEQTTSVGSASVVRRTYSPALGQYTSAPAAAVQCLRLRWQELFTYDDPMEDRYQDGDATLVLPPATALSTSDTIAEGGEDWSVLAVKAAGGCVAAHVRRK